MPDERLIVGLDLPDAAAARAMVATLGGEIGFYKIGLGLLASGGLDLAAELKAAGKRVFLDLKLFDIGATVTAATRSLVAAGRRPTSSPSTATPTSFARPSPVAATPPTRILAVTVLTSLDRADLDEALIRDGDARRHRRSSAPAAPSPPAPTA